MRKEYKIFTFGFGFAFVLSLIYNINKLYNYPFFSPELNDTFFGLSYTTALLIASYIIGKHVRYTAEKIVYNVFRYFALTSFLDELFFDPYKMQLYEHITGIIITLILIYNARNKEDRN